MPGYRLFSFRTLVLPICCLGILTACAGDDNSPNRSQAPADQPIAAIAAPQSLLVWHPYDGAEREALERIRLEFEVAYPNLDVQLQYVAPAALLTEYEAAVNAGAGPDLLFAPAEWMPGLVDQGLIQAVDQALFEQASDRLPRPIALALALDGIPYGIPFSAEFPTLYTNRALVQAVPEFLEDLLADLDAPHSWLITPTFAATSAFYFSPGAQLMDATGHSLVDANSLEIYLAQLADLAAQPGIVFTTDISAFKEGRASLLLASSSDYAALKAALGDDLGTAPLPRVQGRLPAPLVTVQPIMQNINSTLEAAAAASQFITFLISPQAQSIWFEGTSSAPVNLTDLPDTLLRTAWFQALDHSVPAPPVPDFQTVLLPQLDAAVQAVTLNNVDPSAAAQTTLAALSGQEK